jgi:hypothetical protein
LLPGAVKQTGTLITHSHFAHAQVLEKAYKHLGKQPIVYRMNPKAMARQQVCCSLMMY